MHITFRITHCILPFAGKLKIFIDKIPGLTISGEGELDLTEEEKQLSENLRIIYHGDGDIDHTPTNILVCCLILLDKIQIIHSYTL